MIEFEAQPAHVVEVKVPRKFVITLTDKEATDLAGDLIRFREILCPTLATTQLLGFLTSRNN